MDEEHNDIYTVEIQSLCDGDDSFVEIPPEVLEGLGWKEGDDVKFEVKEDGSVMIKRISLESVELDFDEEDLFKYMQIANDQGISFNELCENALKEAVIKEEFENECG
tara:strand:- start:205 stop:528 length:324 start_codon:yes stop_codon:yes gene_type:complete